MTMPVSTPIRPAYSQLTSSANAVDAITSSISVAVSLHLHHDRTRFFDLTRPEQFDLKLVTAVEMIDQRTKVSFADKRSNPSMVLQQSLTPPTIVHREWQNVCLWHIADMPLVFRNVRFRG